MIRLYLKRAVLLFAAAAVTCGLATEFGPWPAALSWATVSAIGCSTGAFLLRTSEVGRITWRNHLAGYLIPWGWRLNGGRLWPVPLISWAVWTAVGGAALLLQPVEEPPAIWARVGLFTAWAIDTAVLMYLLGTIAQATSRSRVGSLRKILAVIIGVLGASLGLYLGGFTTAALIVAGGPTLVIGGGFGLVVLIFVTVGRNTRWN
ncbi:unnamed protein product [Gemmata massiliana]|uniref:Uncharacterized protein n=1 Tax=Gemmata massiliana TaxID=1210884 RepID=A0A6P2D4I7_9BACT|nr:hypothetical protein [Gemmata massiliana]VTR94330.1 unnamed protein product [Gemmata massiliana]